MFFFGCGNGSFANQIQYSTGSSPISIILGDFNNDSRLDIVVANYWSNTVSVLLGYGNGSFTNQTTYSTGARPVSIAIGDFDKDTHLDIVVASSHDGSFSVLLQYNRGFMASKMAYASAGASNLRYIAVGDVNNDTQVDIVVVNYGTSNIGVLFGYGNGSFPSSIILNTSSDSYPSSIALGDLNGDNVIDIAVVNYVSKKLVVLLGIGDGAFTEQTSYGVSLDFAPIVVGLGDFNNDRRSEIVVLYDNSANLDVFAVLNIGSFENQVTYLTGNRPGFIAVDDFNNDSQLDIVVANYGSGNVSVFLGYGNGSFSNQMTYSTGNGPTSVAVGDFNDETGPDIVVANFYDNTVSVLLGYGNGSFANQITYSTGRRPELVVVGDFNNDSRLDIVVTNIGDNNVGILLGYGNGSFANQITYATGSDPGFIAVGDFNNDNRLDIVITNIGDNNVGILLGYGNGSFANQITYATGSNPSFIAVGDFDNDTHLDIVVIIGRSNNIGVLLGYGNASFANQITYSTGFVLNSIAVGDFNNDSRLDIVVVSDIQIISVLGNGDGSFGNPIIYPVGSFPTRVAVGDFNNDSRMDIAVVSSYFNQLGVLLGRFNEVFLKRTTLENGKNSRPQSLVIADFNNDNRMDIGIVNSGTHSIGIFLGSGNISFTNQTTYSTDPDSSPCSIAVGDFNNDTWLDVVVANHGSDNVGIFLGYGNGTLANQVTYSTGLSSSPYSVAVGDIDNDTITDIVVANYGTNNVGAFLGYGDGTFSSVMLFRLAYGSRPFFILVDDFNNDHKPDLAVANSGTDNLNILLQTC